jgi:hypothetical protein
MRTGEGKTFAAIAPALLFAKRYGSVHVVTANPYLAERDSKWSGGVLRYLGLSVAATLPGQARATTRAAYQADVVYGAASDFGFDYLRDRLVLPGDEPVQRARCAAIVDEVDAVLIDGATTPLVLSATTPIDEGAVREADRVVKELLASGDPRVVAADLTLGRVELTDIGIGAVEDLLGVDNLFGADDSDWPHLIHTALRAHVMLQRDRDYVVRGGEDSIGVVDELTGRVLPGRRWSDGLHQAVEAKEQAAMTLDRRALGQITVGGYFRGYDVLVGMSGTLEGAEAELTETYGMHTVDVPTNRSVQRVDHPDLEAADEASKFRAVVDDTEARHRRSQPVLIGTVSIAQASRMSWLLRERAVPHRVLTARNDAEEAAIIARAGMPHAVTVATQMAGRGVDIVVETQDGLMVWGVEHHGSRRLDLQLRGRTGRQGAIGETRFAIAPDDPLLQLAENTLDAQVQLERLDAAARRDLELLDGPIDTAHDRVHEWRLEAVDPLACRSLLDAAIEVSASQPLPAFLTMPSVAGRLPGTAGRRQRELSRRVHTALDARASTTADGTWDLVVSAVLRRILLDLWTDAIDQFDSDKNLQRISHLFGVQRRAWAFKVESRYAAFRVQAQRAWVLHLLAAQVDTGPSRTPHGSAVPRRPTTYVTEDRDVEVDLEHDDWTGPSYNKFWRRHLSMVPPDPPLVLELDAIGDLAAGAIRVDLDHDDPSCSRVVLPEPSG